MSRVKETGRVHTLVSKSFSRDGIILLVHISSNALIISNCGSTLNTNKHKPNVWAASNIRTYKKLGNLYICAVDFTGDYL